MLVEKLILHRIRGSLLVAIAALTWLGGVQPSTADPVEPKLNFERGIGFYWEADGQTHFLYWTDDPTKASGVGGIIGVFVRGRTDF